MCGDDENRVFDDLLEMKFIKNQQSSLDECLNLIQKMDDVMKDDQFFRHKAVKVHKLRNFKLTSNVTNVSHVIA